MGTDPFHSCSSPTQENTRRLASASSRLKISVSQSIASGMPSSIDDEAASSPPALLVGSASNFGTLFDRPSSSHLLSPHDAAISPPLRARAAGSHVRATLARPGCINGERGRGARERRRKRSWKKLMWVKQSYPDNYTDQATFLENLQRNPRLKPYDFWPLVADSTVILQHVCSVILFVVCFVGIFQDRVSPISVVSWSSFATFLGWILWERWMSEEDPDDEIGAGTAIIIRGGSIRRRGRAASIRRPLHSPRTEALTPATSSPPQTLTTSATDPSNVHQGLKQLPASPTTPPTPMFMMAAPKSPETYSSSGSARQAAPVAVLERPEHGLPDDNRLHQRLQTIKSALLIYSTLLGLSPILKSLTRSTSSDSIWAMSFWLLAINIFFFDYSGGVVGAKFPASLSTNAALMASTMLASRLPSTKQVFNLTLFSIEVFGLFPVFRRHVRHRSWRYHVVLTALLVLGAGLGVGTVLAKNDDGRWPWKGGLVGMVVGVFLAALAAGGCSWWLIGLQKYKNEIRGPWDPARPIMSRTGWSDR